MSAGDPASATVSSMARARVLTALVVALAAGVAFDVAPAHAGLRTTAWNFDSETVPARQAELELWLTNLVAGVDGAAGTTSLLVAPVIGLVDGVELALPMTFDYSRADGATTMGVYGAEVRWRLAPSLLGRKTGWVPLLRAGARRSPASDEQIRLLGTAVLGGNPTPELHVVANLGVVAITDPSAVALEYGAGALYAVTPDVKLGLDAFGRHQIKGTGPSATLAVGPALALTHGRFWLALSVPVGLTSDSPDVAPRMIWALAF